MVIRYGSAIVTIAGVLAFLSGIAFWFGVAPGLVSMHMLLGLLTVAGLWAVAVAQALSGGSILLAAIAVGVGALTIYVGINQTAMLSGEHHWLIQLGHVILGVLSIGVCHMAAARQRRGTRL